MLRSVKLQDYMLDRPVTVAPGVSLFDAVDLIIEHRVSGICVVDPQGNLLGILSELDCLRGILAATYNQTEVGQVREHMVAVDITCADPGDDIINIATDMLNKGQRRRPVVDSNRKLVGQITCRQILAAVRQFSHRKSSGQ